MAIQLATKFLPYVDEKFTKESKKSVVTNNDYDWTGAHTIKVYKISTSEMNDYDRDGTGDNPSRYGAVAGLNAVTEEMTLKNDRSFTFAIDKLDCDETVRNLQAASALERQVREVVIPEVDSYVYGVMCSGAGTTPAAAALTATNIYEKILDGSRTLDNELVPETGRVLIVTPDTYTLMKKCKDITMETEIGNDMRVRGVIANLDGMQVIKVPASRLPEGFGFMICHSVATVAPTKLEDYKIHEDPPGISGSLVEGRICYDAFVLDNKAKAIYYQRTPATGLTVTSAAGSTTGKTAIIVTPVIGDGNSYKYAVDTPLLAVGDSAANWTAWNGSADIAAATDTVISIVEVDSNNKVVKGGSAVVIAKS